MAGSKPPEESSQAGSASAYRLAREPLVRKAAQIATTLRSESGEERDQILRIVRGFEVSIATRERSPVPTSAQYDAQGGAITATLGSPGQPAPGNPTEGIEPTISDVRDYPLTTQLGQILGGSATRAAAAVEALSKEMGDEEEWSKEDAERRLAQLQAAAVEVEALPVATWARFFGGLGSSLLASASALLIVAELRVWPALISSSDWPFYVPSGLLYLVGLVLIAIALRRWSKDESDKRARYNADF